ncbi:MAG: hypothetical protein U0L05_06160 [Schaedlerella sp.]|nr:hypothetical protein [Schaedlerella sp.]
MATRLTEKDQLIIEPEKDDYQLCIIYEMFISLCFWVAIYLMNVQLHVAIILYILLEIVLFSCAIVPRHSKYVLDSRGITKKFWKYETTFLWEQFETKRIEQIRGRADCYKAAIFSVKRVERPKWYNPLE